MGLFVWYFGVDRRYETVAHHTILMGPRYRELLRDIFERKRLAPDFSLYLHRPTATDPSLAPKGCDTFYVLSPVPNLLGGQDWRVEAEPYRRKIAQALEASILPGLSQALVTSRVATPLDFHDQLNSYLGAGFGLEPDSDAKRLVPATQRERGCAQSLSGGRGNPPGRRPSRGPVLRPRSRQGRSACLGFCLIRRSRV